MLPTLPQVGYLFGLCSLERPPVTRRFFAQVPEGMTQEIDPPPGVVTVHCRNGEAWITHDGDPRDVFLNESETYVADTRNRMTVHSMRGNCVMEFEVQDPGTRGN